MSYTYKTGMGEGGTVGSHTYSEISRPRFTRRPKGAHFQLCTDHRTDYAPTLNKRHNKNPNPQNTTQNLIQHKSTAHPKCLYREETFRPAAAAPFPPMRPTRTDLLTRRITDCIAPSFTPLQAKRIDCVKTTPDSNESRLP